MPHHDELKDQWISQLKNDWQQLDRLETPSAPSKTDLKEQLSLAKAMKRTTFYKELALFILLALLILTILTTVIYKMPLFFIWTQILTIVTGPIIFLILLKKKNKEDSLYER